MSRYKKLQKSASLLSVVATLAPAFMSVATVGATPVIAADDTTAKTGSGTKTTANTATTSNGSFSDLLNNGSADKSASTTTTDTTSSSSANTESSGTKLSSLMSTSDVEANPGVSSSTLEQYVKDHPSYTPGVTRKGAGYTVTDLPVQASNSRATLSIQSGPALSIVLTNSFIGN